MTVYACPRCDQEFDRVEDCVYHITLCRKAANMKVNQEVSYIDSDNKRHVATVTEITGAGPSNYKTLNLRYTVAGEAKTVENVPHEGDAKEGEGFWLLKGERRKRTPEDEPLNAEPVVTSAFPEPGAGTPKGRSSRRS